MAADHALDKVLSVILRKRFPGIKQISAIQKQALYAIFNGRDVFAILPTGYGKSLTFQLLPDLYREFPPLPQLSERQVDNPIVLIICPLKSLVESHIRELRPSKKKLCFSSGFLPKSREAGHFFNFFFLAKVISFHTV